MVGDRNTMMLKVENLKKPSNKKWKMIADYLLYVMLPAINIFFITVEPVSPEFSLWGNAISTFLITSFKGLTKFASEQITEE